MKKYRKIITNNINEGEIYAPNSYYVGGIVGEFSSDNPIGEIQNNINAIINNNFDYLNILGLSGENINKIINYYKLTESDDDLLLCSPYDYLMLKDFIFIDEAQDLSKAQQQLMLASIEEGGRFIAVGDPRQAINGFCGAMNDSFNQLEVLAQNSLPLSVNYRCGSNMINLAQEIVPQIEAHEGAIEGLKNEIAE